MNNDQLKESNKKELPSILYVFSGTGNSLNVALKIQERVKNCEIKSIPNAFHESDFEIMASKIGIIFPVYFLDIPHILKKFLKNLKILGDPYIFAIATCGGEIGISFRTIDKILSKIDKKLNSEYKMIFPSNSIVMIDKSNTPEEIIERLRDSSLIVEKITKSIISNEKVKYSVSNASFTNKMISLSGKIFLHRILNDRLFKVDEDLCKRCGICEYVCPMHNIERINGFPSWSRNCECCAACIHWCPQNAINNLNTKGKPRYRHPEITPKMMKSYQEC